MTGGCDGAPRRGEENALVSGEADEGELMSETQGSSRA